MSEQATLDTTNALEYPSMYLASGCPSNRVPLLS